MDVRAVEHHGAVLWLEEPRQRLEQGAFAAAVAADQHGHLAFGQLQIKAVDNHLALVTQGQVMGCDGRHPKFLNAAG
ncbi:hypothetical protein ALP75_200523 [Pseudomonas syringae pv. actinidiae]|nr:hypothetical protein ALP75_200523 [Pseudomonas syringae pv. actinidiae]